MGAWDDVATSFTQTRERLGTLDRPVPVSQPRPPRREQQSRPARPRPVSQPAPAPVAPKRDQVTEDEIKALGELQQRGAQFGVDTTQLNPKPDQKVGDFIGDVNTVFDDAEKTLLGMAQAAAEARVADPAEQVAPFTAAAGQTPAGPESPLGRILGLADVTEPIIDPEFAERQGRRLPGIAGDIAGPVLGAGAEITTPLDIALMLSVAGVGGVAASGLRGAGRVGRIAAGLVEPLAKTFPRAVAAEAAIGTGAVLAAIHAGEALEDAPTPVRVAGALGAGLAGGVATLAAPTAGRRLLKEAGELAVRADLPQRVTEIAGRVLPERKVFAAGVEDVGDIASRTNPAKIDPRDATFEEITQAMENAGLDEHQKLVKALGSEEKAKRFERLDRTQNSLDIDRADAASVELNEMLDGLTPEQDLLIHGNINEPEMTREALKELQTSSSFGFDDDAQLLVTVVTRRLSRLSPKKIETLLNQTRQEAIINLDVVDFVAVREATAGLRNLGWDNDKIFSNVVRKLQSEGVEATDIDVLIGPFTGGRAATPPTAGALPAAPAARQADAGAQRIDPDELPQTGQITFDETGEVRQTGTGPREDDIIGDDSLRVQGQFFGEEDLKVYDDANPVDDLPLWNQVYEDTPIGNARRDADLIEQEFDVLQGRVTSEGLIRRGAIDRENATFSTVGISDDVLVEMMTSKGLNPYEPGALMNVELLPEEIGTLRKASSSGAGGLARTSKAKDRAALKTLREDLVRARTALEDAEDAAFKTESLDEAAEAFRVESGTADVPVRPAVAARAIEEGPPLDVLNAERTGGLAQQETFGEITKVSPTESVKPFVKTVREANAELDNEFIKNAIPDSPEDVGASAEMATGSVHSFINSMPKKNTPPSQAFAEGMESLRNVGPVLARQLDPGRLFETIQNGYHGGLISKYIGYPTKRMHQNSINFTKKLKIEVQGIYDRSGLTKLEHREATWEVLNHLGRNDVGIIESTLLERSAIKNVVKQFRPDIQTKIVAYAQELRDIFIDGHNTMNLARAQRGDKPIGFIENYAPWVQAQKSWLDEVKSVGFRRGDDGLVSGLTKKATDDIFGDRTYPTFVAPERAFNARAMERTFGLKDVAKEKDINVLMASYIDSMTAEIYHNTIINNVFRHTKPMRESGLNQAADALDDYAREAWAGTPTPQGRAIRNVLPERVVGAGLSLRRQLTRAVFPFNWLWNIGVQTSSVVNTIARYGVRNNVRALDVLIRPSIKAEVNKAYSVIIKKRDAGRVAYQDIGESIERSGKLKQSKMERVEHVANYLTSAIEDKLNAHAVRAAQLRGEQMGFKGRDLLEFASDGAARTQSMYDKQNVVALLRSKEVGALAPFQTFAFEILNTLREFNIPGVRKVIGQAGAYNTLTAKTALGKATTQRRVKMLMEWVAAMYVANLVSDKLIDRKPWNVGSFVPFYSIIFAGAQGYGPMNTLLPVKYIGDFYDGVTEFLDTGRWHPLRNFVTRYHVLGGSQITKTMIGIEAVAEGAVRDKSGSAKFEVNPEEWLTAYSKGVYATQGGEEYIEDKFARSTAEELTGIPIPDFLSSKSKLDRRYREEFESYLDIATTPEERKEKGQALSRLEFRKANPEIDIHLFATGRVRSLQKGFKDGKSTRQIAQQFFFDEKIITPDTDEKDLAVYRRHLGPSFVDFFVNPPKDAPAPDPTPETQSAVPSAEDNWSRVSDLMDVEDLTALQKVWDGKVISRNESTSLRKVFKQEPLGQSNFRTWMKQTLRQVQQNAAVASRARESQEFATV